MTTATISDSSQWCLVDSGYFRKQLDMSGPINQIKSTRGSFQLGTTRTVSIYKKHCLTILFWGHHCISCIFISVVQVRYDIQEELLILFLHNIICKIRCTSLIYDCLLEQQQTQLNNKSNWLLGISWAVNLVYARTPPSQLRSIATSSVRERWPPHQEEPFFATYDIQAAA